MQTDALAELLDEPLLGPAAHVEQQTADEEDRHVVADATGASRRPRARTLRGKESVGGEERPFAVAAATMAARS